MNKQRRHFSAPEKVAILKRHLLEKTPVSDLCDELGIAPNLFYRWQKEFFENGHAAFESDRKSKAVEDAKQRKIEQLEAKLQRKNEVLSELMEEHTQLKKLRWQTRVEKLEGRLRQGQRAQRGGAPRSLAHRPGEGGDLWVRPPASAGRLSPADLHDA